MDAQLGETIALNRRTMKVWGIALAALAALAVPAFGQDALPTPEQQNPGWWLPEAASDYSWEVDRLWIWIFWIVIGMFVLTEGLLIYFCIVYRRRPGHRPTYTHGNNKAEITWTVVPALMLLGIAIIQIPTWDKIKKPDWAKLRSDPNTLNVDVLGQQFKWNVRYPGSGKQFNSKYDLSARLPIHMPFGKTAVFSLRSADVIHSVFIPAMRVKQDTVPGLRQSLWFKPNRFFLVRLKEDNGKPVEPVSDGKKTFDGALRKVQPTVWVSLPPGDPKDPKYNPNDVFEPNGTYYTKKIAVSPISDYNMVDGFYSVPVIKGVPKKVNILHQGKVSRGEWTDCDFALGVFEIACAELCGYEHHTMRSFLIIEPPASFNAWISEMIEEIEPDAIWKAWRP